VGAQLSDQPDSAGRTASAFIDKSLFLVVALIGAVAIAALKLRGVDQLVVTAVPVALLLIYVALISLNTRFRLRLDQAGDNAYYLGFIFTLISLGVALYQFVGGAQRVTETIIQNFGIALATTIVGITLRVVLHQMREDPIDTEKAARLELAAAAQALRAQVSQVMVEINRMRVEFQQRQGEYENEIAERRTLVEQQSVQRQQVQDQSVQELTQAVRATVGGLAELGGALARQLEAMQELMRNAAASNSHADAVAASAAKFARNLDRGAVYGELIERNMQQWAQQIAQQQAALTVAMEQSRVVSQQLLARLAELERGSEREQPPQTGTGP